MSEPTGVRCKACGAEFFTGQHAVAVVDEPGVEDGAYHDDCAPSGSQHMPNQEDS